MALGTAHGRHVSLLTALSHSLSLSFLCSSSGDPTPYLATNPIAPTSGIFAFSELGVSGQVGLFYPSWMSDESAPHTEEWRDVFPETHRGWRDPKLLARMMKPTDINETLWTGSGKAFVPPWCAAVLDPSGCTVNSDAFGEGTCRVVRWEPSCAVVLGQAKDFDPRLAALIYGQRLNLTAIYLGDGFEPFLRQITAQNDALALSGKHHQRVPFLAMSWLPYGITLQTSLARVAFPPFHAGCVSSLAADFYGVSAHVTCDFELTPLKKVSGFRLSAPAWSDVKRIIDGLVLKTEEQSELIKDIVTEQDTWPNITWNKACNWLKQHPNRWTGLVQNTLPPPPPYTSTPGVALTGAVRGIAALVLFLALILHALLVKYRSRSEIKGFSVAYCHVMATGPVLASIGVLLIPELGSVGGEGVCAAAPVLFSIGFNLIFGSAFLKTYRYKRAHRETNKQTA